MHLLLARGGATSDEGEAVDLGQDPAEICVLSAADTELSALAAAQAGVRADAPSLRLANLMRLSHPMSVDQWIERTGRHAKIVVARVLGGRGYFPHGLDALAASARKHGTCFVALPGDGQPDPELHRFSTMGAEDAAALWRYLVEGGAANARGFLDHAARMLGRPREPAPPRPLPDAGLWWRGRIASIDEVRADWLPGRPVAAIAHYRALLQGGQTEAIDALVDALHEQGLNPLPVFAASLKNAGCQTIIRSIFESAPPRVVINTTGFAVSSPGQRHEPTVLDEGGAVVLQAVLAGVAREGWAASSQGLGPRDLAMNVALPEVDGRVLTRAIAFKSANNWDERTQCDLMRSAPDFERIGFVAELARRWATIPQRACDREVGIVLSNYPVRDGRVGNGVGLDTPAGTICLLEAMRAAGYEVASMPSHGNALVERLLQGPTNSGLVDGTFADRTVETQLPLARYEAFFAKLPNAVRTAVLERWGEPGDDRAVMEHEGERSFALSIVSFGNVHVGVQPARGYDLDPKETYHSPDLVPPHHYFAFYAWLRDRADAIIHMGKHGNMEWLPGKALALSSECFPEAVFGPMPHIYPFIVNDPGEGSQAKRRAQAVIVDHLTPPLSRAESHGPMAQLEALADEFFDASSSDPRRAKLLEREIADLAHSSGLAEEIGLSVTSSLDDAALEKIDAWLCDLKEMQIRDGLHVFGQSPEGRLRTDLLAALVRVPRGEGAAADAGLTRALAADLRLDFDPLCTAMGAPWEGPRPEALASVTNAPWRIGGDTVERLELLAAQTIEKGVPEGFDWPATSAVLQGIEDNLGPALDACGEREIAGVLRALEGRFLEPGPSGAPTRGRSDVLPTGRNFYSVDTRSVPTPAAWTLGAKSAEQVMVRHLQEHGDWLRAVGLSCWGTANMRTGGDDIAQAMALIGARPTWDGASRRVTGFEIISLAELGRPRVDVTLRISGFFRDAFPEQIALFDRAARAVGALDEPDDENPIAARMRSEREVLVQGGMETGEAERRAGFRVFGSKPESYGAGLQALIDQSAWRDAGDLAEAYTVWGAYAYGAREMGSPDREGFERRLGAIEAVLHNQDNREHDLLDSDDYYQFEGGMTAAVTRLRDERPAVYHNDHSRPEKPVTRSLEEEIARVVRARVTNPKWIAGMMRHGYKGAFELAATVDYLFAFAATTGAVTDRQFDAVHDAFVMDDKVREWMLRDNPNAARELAERLDEAVRRGLWRPRRNSVLAERTNGGDAADAVVTGAI